MNGEKACDGDFHASIATSMRSWNGKVFCVAGKAHDAHWKGFVESRPSRGESPPSASVHRFPSPDLDRKISCSLSVLCEMRKSQIVWKRLGKVARLDAFQNGWHNVTCPRHLTCEELPGAPLQSPKSAKNFIETVKICSFSFGNSNKRREIPTSKWDGKWAREGERVPALSATYENINNSFFFSHFELPLESVQCSLNEFFLW